MDFIIAKLVSARLSLPKSLDIDHRVKLDLQSPQGGDFWILLDEDGKTVLRIVVSYTSVWDGREFTDREPHISYSVNGDERHRQIGSYLAWIASLDGTLVPVGRVKPARVTASSNLNGGK